MALPEPTPVERIDAPVDPGRFAQIRDADRPVLIGGLASDWPAVAAARSGDAAIAAYLTREPALRPVRAIAAKPEEGGRFFYDASVTQLNFITGEGRLETFLDDLLAARDMERPPSLAIQSEPVGAVLPHVARENRVALLPDVPPRIWIGNRIRVAPHYDVKENLAVCVAGRRRFTLFPPDQLGNLYPGPLELTPAGTPVSMVDLAGPDLATHPRYAEAARHALRATLEPGDAIYIPYCWWHGVESLDPVSILVNYWWLDRQPEGAAAPYDALLHALLAYRHLPPAQRDVWRTMLDHYVFEASGDPAAHLPDAAKGMLGPASPTLFARMRATLRAALS